MAPEMAGCTNPCQPMCQSHLVLDWGVSPPDAAFDQPIQGPVGLKGKRSLTF